MNKQTKKSSIKCVINHIEKKSICVSKLSARQRQKKKHTASIQDDFFFCTHEWKYAQKKELTLLEEITHMPSNVIAFHIDVAMAIFPTQSKTLNFFHYSAFICSYTVHYISFYFYSLPIFETSTSSSVMYFVFLCIFLFMIQLYMFFSTSSVISW